MVSTGWVVHLPPELFQLERYQEPLEAGGWLVDPVLELPVLLEDDDAGM
jgi:hypothetical protein